jgi:sRNA-binding protein
MYHIRVLQLQSVCFIKMNIRCMSNRIWVAIKKQRVIHGFKPTATFLASKSRVQGETKQDNKEHAQKQSIAKKKKSSGVNAVEAAKQAAIAAKNAADNSDIAYEALDTEGIDPSSYDHNQYQLRSYAYAFLCCD